MSGTKVAALYGIVTNKLGLCGPQKKATNKTLSGYLSGKRTSEKKIRNILKDFKGAFPYYKLIAQSNKIKDPFDERVVMAYWIGNALLEKVRTPDLKKMIINDFSAPGFLKKRYAEEKAKKVSKNSKPHHSFHVLMIGSVSGIIVLTKKLIDICRIGWGEVIKLDEGKGRIKVEYQPLILAKKSHLGALKEKYLIWDKNILPTVKIGNLISFHWNHAIQVLEKKDVENLKKYTQKTLKALVKMK